MESLFQLCKCNWRRLHLGVVLGGSMDIDLKLRLSKFATRILLLAKTNEIPNSDVEKTFGNTLFDGV